MATGTEGSLKRSVIFDQGGFISCGSTHHVRNPLTSSARASNEWASRPDDVTATEVSGNLQHRLIHANLRRDDESLEISLSGPSPCHFPDQESDPCPRV